MVGRTLTDGIRRRPGLQQWRFFSETISDSERTIRSTMKEECSPSRMRAARSRRGLTARRRDFRKARSGFNDIVTASFLTLVAGTGNSSATVCRDWTLRRNADSLADLSTSYPRQTAFSPGRRYRQSNIRTLPVRRSLLDMTSDASVGISTFIFRHRSFSYNFLSK